ncbi:MAG: hypothetical protein HYY03_01170 [Chloroflexi bacterium]|nr:hypothetical protein [Chloroflexota bacterium]
MAEAVSRRIALDRRVCVVAPGRIEVRPERGAIIGPLIGLAVGLGLFVAVASFANSLPVEALAAMLIPGVIIAPFSAMGLLYSLIGAHVVIDARKQSARFQQGVLGLGLGTVELAPFWKIDRIEVEDLDLGEVVPRGPPPPLDLRGWEIVLVKASGKRLPIGQVLAANTPDLVDEGFGRALDAAEAIAALVAKPMVITAAVEEDAEEASAESAAEASREEAPREPRRATG